MTTQNLTLMQATIQKMHWHEGRQKVLAQNIANADTPLYTPQDIAPLNFKGLLESSASKLPLSAATTGSAGHLTTTNSKHLDSSGTSGSYHQALEKNQKNPYEASPSGNAVILEEQLLKMNENYADHRLTTTIYQKNIDLLKSSIRSQ
ncbi:MAG: flagellar basal body rod protein FlgB [Pseudomonadota bacterium]